MKFSGIIRNLAAALAVALTVALAPLAGAASQGIQFIGLSKAATGEMKVLSDELVKVGGDLHVAFLPFEFNPGNPFGNATELIKSTLPRLNGKLRVTVYVRWYPHDADGNTNQAAFWSAWGATAPTAAQTNIRNAFLARVDQLSTWVSSTRAWAKSTSQTTKLDGFYLVPILGDRCRDSGAYNRLLAAVQTRQSAVADAQTRFRRSCLLPPEADGFRPSNHPLELHGRWGAVSRYLQSNDVWSNDGTEMSIADYIDNQSSSLAKGVHAAVWRQAYNGSPRERANWDKRTVNPFTGPSKAAELDYLRRALRKP